MVRVMKISRRVVAAVALVLGFGFGGCNRLNLPSPNLGSGATASVHGVRNDTRVDNPETQALYPDLLRLLVIGVDRQLHNQDGLMLRERVGVERGERTLTLLAEEKSGRRTVSRVTFTALSGGDYVLRPVRTDQGYVAAVLNGPYGEEVARSAVVAPGARGR